MFPRTITVKRECLLETFKPTSALENYRNQSIQDSINSENPLERMFAVLDRRVGKRSLGKIKETMEEQSEWLQQFYRLRLHAENL